MGELEVITFLEKNKGQYFSLKEICDGVKEWCNSSATTKIVKKLSDRKEIKCISVDVNLARKIYGKTTKRKMNLYYV